MAKYRLTGVYRNYEDLDGEGNYDLLEERRRFQRTFSAATNIDACVEAEDTARRFAWTSNLKLVRFDERGRETQIKFPKTLKRR